MPTLADSLIESVVAFSSAIPGHYRTEELALLFRSAMSCPDKGRIVEVGVWGGRSSSAILQAARAKDMHVDLVDPWVWMETEGEPHFRETAKHFADVDYTVHKVYSSEAAERIHGPLDMVHIDGDHQLDGVLLDCRNWLPKLKPGALACFHDYGNTGLPDVKTGVDQAVGDWKMVNLVNTLLVVRKP